MCLKRQLRHCVCDMGMCAHSWPIRQNQCAKIAQELGSLKYIKALPFHPQQITPRERDRLMHSHCNEALTRILEIVGAATEFQLGCCDYKLYCVITSYTEPTSLTGYSAQLSEDAVLDPWPDSTIARRTTKAPLKFLQDTKLYKRLSTACEKHHSQCFLSFFLFPSAEQQTRAHQRRPTFPANKISLSLSPSKTNFTLVNLRHLLQFTNSVGEFSSCSTWN